MPVTQHITDNKLVISIEGPFNFAEHPGFRNSYRNVKPDSVLCVSVNLQQTNYMDSSALGMLLLLDEHFKHQRIHLAHCSDGIKQVLNIANFSKKFTID